MRDFINNEQHPFLEIYEEQENNNWFCQIGLREFNIDRKVDFSQMVGGNPIALGILPDPEHITQTKMTESFKNRYRDHLVGTTMNEFIKRVMCRKHLGNFANLQLFVRNENKVMTSKLNPAAVEVFFQMVMSGFPFLAGAIKETEKSVVIRIDQRGTWYTRDGQELPKVNPGIIELEYQRLAREFESLLADSEGDSSAVNEAMKGKLLCSLSSVMYRMKFEQEINPETIKDPNKLQIVQKPISLSDRLKYDLQKAQDEGRVVKR